ncbi:MAG TPA: iron chelate uptake ABC transporter family permease subunit, partial [Umezawaea sp.]|nr:iron chelate uptake ABC transporter family permease subunit [Umezawaea sp.]
MVKPVDSDKPARQASDPVPLRLPRLRPVWLVVGLLAVFAALLLGVSTGPVTLPVSAVAKELLSLLPGVDLDSGLSERERALLVELRLPRVVLGLLVGGLLALAGACYQGVFRNPLADPHLLGVAAGAGLGVTAVITLRRGAGSAAAAL